MSRLYNPFMPTISFVSGLLRETDGGGGGGGGGDDNNTVVKSGDTLSQIAADNNMSVEELATANNITNLDSIQAGQTLDLSGANSGSSTYNNGVGTGGIGSDNDSSSSGGGSSVGEGSASSGTEVPGDGIDGTINTNIFIPETSEGSASTGTEIPGEGILGQINNPFSSDKVGGVGGMDITSTGEDYTPTSAELMEQLAAAGQTNLTDNTSSNSFGSATDDATWGSVFGTDENQNTLAKYTDNETSGLDDYAQELLDGDGTFDGTAADALINANQNGGQTNLEQLALSPETLSGTLEYANSDQNSGGGPAINPETGRPYDPGDPNSPDYNASLGPVQTNPNGDTSTLDGPAETVAKNEATQQGERADGVDAILVEKYGWTMGPDGDAIEPGTGSLEAAEDSNQVTKLSSNLDLEAFNKALPADTSTLDGPAEAVAKNAATQQGERADGVDAILVEKYGWTMGPDGDAIEPDKAGGTDGTDGPTLGEDGLMYNTDGSLFQGVLDGVVYSKGYQTNGKVGFNLGDDMMLTKDGLYYTGEYEGKMYEGGREVTGGTGGDGTEVTGGDGPDGDDTEGTGFPVTIDGVTYSSQAELDAALAAGGDGDDDTDMGVDYPITIDGVTYNTEAELFAALQGDLNDDTVGGGDDKEEGDFGYGNEDLMYRSDPVNVDSSGGAADDATFVDTNQDGKITSLEQEIANLRSQLATLTGANTNETTGMSREEIISAINSAMKSNSSGYDPMAFMNAFGYSMQPSYFGNTIPTFQSENGVYSRRAVKDKDTGETRYVNVPIANGGGQGIGQYRKNRRQGFGSLV